MRARGHALMIVMTVMTATVLAGSVFSTRILAVNGGRRAQAARLQALWLARSACTAGFTGRVELGTEAGPAVVSRVGTTVRVTLGDGLAEADCQGGAATFR